MARAVWKGINYIKSEALDHGKKIWYKGLKIEKGDVGKQVKVYNGNRFIEILIEERMVGYTLGSFLVTKKLGTNIHKKKSKNKKKK